MVGLNLRHCEWPLNSLLGISHCSHCSGDGCCDSCVIIFIILLGLLFGNVITRIAMSVCVPILVMMMVVCVHIVMMMMPMLIPNAYTRRPIAILHRNRALVRQQDLERTALQMTRKREVFSLVRVLQNNWTSRLKLIVIDHIVPCLERRKRPLLAHHRIGLRQILVDNRMLVLIQRHILPHNLKL